MSAYKYAYTHPPFNFLGHFSKSQWTAFQAWVAQRQENFTDIALHHRIRAQQLRKTAGVLEQFYSAYNDQTLTPTFSKDAWAPGTDGYASYPVDDDHLPMVMMSRIKTQFKEMLQRDEDATFAMNHVRCLIEKHEDSAQDSHDFVQAPTTNNDANPTTLTALLTKINGYFSQPAYAAVLVDDVNTLWTDGKPYFRVNYMDDLTGYEKYLMNHSDPSVAISIKEEGAVEA